MISTRGLTMERVENVRLAMGQICADESNERTMTAQIMGEHGVTAKDVRTVCEVARDVVVDMRNRNQRATLPTFGGQLVTGPTPRPAPTTDDKPEASTNVPTLEDLRGES